MPLREKTPKFSSLFMDKIVIFFFNSFFHHTCKRKRVGYLNLQIFGGDVILKICKGVGGGEGLPVLPYLIICQSYTQITHTHTQTHTQTHTPTHTHTHTQ